MLSVLCDDKDNDDIRICFRLSEYYDYETDTGLALSDNQ